MYQIITVVYTNRKLNAYEINQQKKYVFVYEGSVIKGDLLQSPNYTTCMQVVSVEQRKTRLFKNRDGQEIVLKDLIVDSINGVPVKNKIINQNQEMSKKNSMFAGIADKYKSQWIPEKEEGVKVSMDGTMCVAIGDEYVGMKSDGTLTSYPREVLIDVPVYSINKPSSQVQIGDVIKSGPKSYGKVMMKNHDGSLKILSYTGYTHNKQEVQDFLLGQAMTRVLVNMFNFDASGFNPFFFMLGSEESEFDVKDLMMLQMMSGNKNLGNLGGMNPLMLMMLSDKGQGGNDMLSLMAMSQMMGGNNLFPNITPSVVKQPTTEEKPAFDIESFVENIKKNPELANKLKAALSAE